MGIAHIKLMPTLFSREMSLLRTHSEMNNKSGTELNWETQEVRQKNIYRKQEESIFKALFFPLF